MDCVIQCTNVSTSNNLSAGVISKSDMAFIKNASFWLSVYNVQDAYLMTVLKPINWPQGLLLYIKNYFLSRKKNHCLMWDLNTWPIV